MTDLRRKHSLAVIEQFRTLWLEGRSINEIAEIMSVTRNVVVGIVHRNHFPPRENPIKRVVQPVTTSTQATTGDGCRWPLWPHASRPTHEYCGAQRAAPGQPYCHEHSALARGPALLKRVR